MHRDPNQPPPMPQSYPTPQGYPMDYYSAASPFINQQIGNQMAQIFQSQVAQYSDNFVSKGRSWIGSNLKYYFAVDTAYVLKKLLLILFPFSHKDWSLKYRNDEPIAPRDDVNAPDLYIPSMAFVTYVLVAGYLLGVNDKFSPEQLGIQASSALGWLVLEVLITMIFLYSLNLTSFLSFLHVLSLSGYKFVPMIGALITGHMFHRFGYYLALCYGSLGLFIFLLRTLSRAVEGSTTNQGSKTIYKLIFYCVVQPFFMYIMTSHLI